MNDQRTHFALAFELPGGWHKLKQKEKDSLRSQHQNGEDLSCNTYWTNAECDDTQGSMEGVRVKQEINSIGEIVRTNHSNGVGRR